MARSDWQADGFWWRDVWQFNHSSGSKWRLECLMWQSNCLAHLTYCIPTHIQCNDQTWNLSKILHRWIFRLKILHRQFHLISTVLVGKKHKKWVKMEKFTPLAKILHCRRHWRHGQIPPLGEIKSFTNDVFLIVNNSKNICVVLTMDVEGCEQSFKHCLSQKMSSSLFWQWLQKGGPVNQTICKKMSSCFKNNSGFVLFPSPFLAVKDSFIGDLVTHSLNDSVSDI